MHVSLVTSTFYQAIDISGYMHQKIVNSLRFLICETVIMLNGAHLDISALAHLHVPATLLIAVGIRTEGGILPGDNGACIVSEAAGACCAGEAAIQVLQF